MMSDEECARLGRSPVNHVNRVSHVESRLPEEMSFDAALYGLCRQCGWPRTDAGRLESLAGICPRCHVDAGANPRHAHVAAWAVDDVLTLPDTIRSRVGKQ
jgi:hypothetical protein